jgi:hypothetical protein
MDPRSGTRGWLHVHAGRICREGDPRAGVDAFRAVSRKSRRFALPPRASPSRYPLRRKRESPQGGRRLTNAA